MVKTGFYLDCRRAKADGLGTIKISIFKDNVRALIPLNIKLPPEYWDAKNQIATDVYKDLNPMLLQRKAVIDSFIFKKETCGEFNGMKSCEIKDLVVNYLFETPNQEKKACITTNNFKARFNSFGMSRVKPGTQKLYADTWVLIEKYASAKNFAADNLKFEDITVKWLIVFNAFMAETSSSQIIKIFLLNLQNQNY